MDNLKIFKLQWKKASKTIGCQISWLILICISSFSFIMEAMHLNGKEFQKISSAARMWSLNGLGESTFKYCYGVYLMCGIPVLSVVIFSDEILSIKHHHTAQFLLTRTSRKQYYTATLSVAFFKSTLMNFLSLTLNQILWLFCCPINSQVPLTQKVNIDFEGASHLIFQNLFFDHPYMYNMIYIFLISIFTGLMALFSASLCFVLKKQFHVLIVPLILYLAENFISAAVGHYGFSISETLSPIPSVTHVTFTTYIIYSLMLLVVSFGCIFYGIHVKRDEFE